MTQCITFCIASFIFLSNLQLVLCNQADGVEDGVIKISNGSIKGMKEISLKGQKFFSFLSIPFAKPPVGHLRLKDPVQVDAWQGVLDATKYPEVCLQASDVGHHAIPVGKEDCLYLNVFTRKLSQNALMPVMIYLHGGSFLSGGSKFHQPYVLMDQNIVLVVIQYRLGPFGFLSTEDEFMSGNFGLKDQTLAMKWVKENIVHFGGDPNRITLFGQSAGGGSANLHMLSPWSQGLFQRVIAQSGTALCPWAIKRNHRKIVKAIGELVGCRLARDSRTFAECLLEIDAYDILQASITINNWSLNSFPFTPRVDGNFIPDDPALLMLKKQYSNVDFMAGITRDDGAIVLYRLSRNDSAYVDLRNNIDRYGPWALSIDDEPMKEDIARRLFQYYLNSKDINRNSNAELMKLFGANHIINCHEVSTFLLSQNPNMNLYKYELHHKGKFSVGDKFKLEEAKEWISHIDDLFYLFEGGDLFHRKMVDPDDLKIRDIITSLWTNFATVGNPTPDGSSFSVDKIFHFHWKSSSNQPKRCLKITKEPSIEEKPNQEEFDFWLSLPLVRYKHIREWFKNKKDEL